VAFLAKPTTSLVSSSPSAHLSDFDYHLPEGLIAQYPLAERSASRMLVIERASGGMHHQHFSDLPQWLNAGDLVVINNTKVIPARLLGARLGADGQAFSGQVEVLLQHPLNAERSQWSVLMRPARKLSPGTVIAIPDSTSTLTVLDRGEMGHGVVQIDLNDADDLDAWLARVGHMPIPPYLGRPAEAQDNQTYQTVFAKVSGSQAAPTAGLHFTPGVMATLKAQGVGIAEVTLTVGAGTFRPVLTEDIAAHHMDAEAYQVSTEAAQAIAQTRDRGGRIVAIGTTVTKTLETVASRHQGVIQADSGDSQLFITPGFRFQVVDALLTNFHLPKSTLLMLVSAFAHRDLILNAYNVAVAERYRFYSYGDCMLLV
jgi:S-adenosylmethionine:tRNA ribosyltransferase-isomerase